MKKFFRQTSTSESSNEVIAIRDYFLKSTEHGPVVVVQHSDRKDDPREWDEYDNEYSIEEFGELFSGKEVFEALKPHLRESTHPKPTLYTSVQSITPSLRPISIQFRGSVSGSFGNKD